MRDLYRRQLDNKISPFRELALMPPPSVGWLKSIREALGITLDQVAHKLKLSKQGVYNLEQAEKSGAISLNSLERVANALNCKVCYILIPEQSIQDTVNAQILKKAKKIATYIDQSMALEGQKTSSAELEEQIKKIVEDLKRKKNISLIWEEDL